MEEKQPIRILHISDFHLNGNYVDDAKTLLQNILDAIEKANQQIDLVVFSGDMIDKGGKDFSGGITEALNTFKTEVIDEICNTLKLSADRFVFTPGNHDVNTQKADNLTDEGIERNYMTDESKVSTFIKDPNLFRSRYFQRIEDVKEFEKNYYEGIMKDDYTYDLLASNFKYLIKDIKIGITSLNSSWRYNDESKRKNSIVLGSDQITDSHPKIKDCQLKLAVTHYDYNELPEFERENIKKMIAQNYDILFVGHTHSSDVEFISTSSGASFLHMKTAGSLIANKHISSIGYQNAFHILSYFSDHIDVVLFEQKNGQFFEQNKSFGNLGDGSGIYREQIPTKEKSIEIAENKELEKKLKELELFFEKIAPFTTIKGQINKITDSFFKQDFVFCDRINEIITTLTDKTSKDIHFLALSGMGKTRIVMEAFKNEDNIYYSPTANCVEQLRILIENKKDCTVIVDDCDNNQRREIKKVIRTYGNNNRLITINNDLSRDEELVDGDVLLKFEYDQASDIITKLIEKERTLTVDEVEIIKEYAGNIPYMAILLIDAYVNNKTLKIDNGDSLLSALLRGKNGKNEKQEKALSSIALFNPLGYSESVSDEYNYVKSNSDIHHITENQKNVDIIFQETIKLFLERRKLIEYRGNCIRVRPKPLAEWLTDYWLTEYGDSIPQIWDELHDRNDSMSKRLISAFCTRIKDMSEYSHAKELFDKMHDICNGSFHDERIAFSDEGSQLFLSMGMVSPVAVSRNLLDLLEHKSDDFEWVKNNITEETRRNLVRAFESMCIYAESFPNSAKALMILAAAENETYSNNSTGIFSQLFQCFLSGTRATLLTRIKVLENAKDKSEFFPIIIKAIDAAFKSRDFMRVESTGKIPKSTEPIDYYPQFSEISEYWDKCAELLLFISKQTPEHDETIKKVVNQHVSDIYSWNKGDILDLLLNYFGDKCSYEWHEIRKTLNYYIKHWSGNDETNKQKALKWYNRFSPKSYLIRVKDAIDNRYVEGRKDFNQFYNDMYELVDPFANEFVEKKIYQTAEMSLILKDWGFQSHWLIQRIIKVIENRYEIIKDIFDSITSFVKKETTTFESPFITQFCFDIIRDEDEKKTTILKGFQKELYDNDYCRLSASIEGIIDDQQHSLLPKIIEDVKSDKYDNYCINNYLHRYRWQNIDNVLSITDSLIKGGIDKEEIVFPYFTTYLMFNELKDIDLSKLERIEEILLSYSFMGQSYNTANQVVELMKSILETHNRPSFALNVHNRIVEVLSTREIIIDNPFDSIYDTLLPKYQNAILDKLCDDIASEDRRMLYYWKIHYSLGSGFGYGAGPLFRCDIDHLKKACLKHPKTLPSRMAQMCPIEEPGKDPTETFFWWLCNNFGIQERMLSEFACNIGTFSFVGGPNNSLADFISQKEKILIPYTKHPNKTVQDWAKKQIESIRKEVKLERDNEEYRKMILDS